MVSVSAKKVKKKHSCLCSFKVKWKAHRLQHEKIVHLTIHLTSSLQQYTGGKNVESMAAFPDLDPHSGVLLNPYPDPCVETSLQF
jgi:hypothetical protein